MTPIDPPQGDRPRERALALAGWRAANSLSCAPYDLERLSALKRETVSVVLPTREVAETIGPIIDALGPARAAGVVDEIVVVDAASGDGTAEIAAARGAAVVQESEILPAFGPARGKGDAMWRGLAATSGEIVVWLDTDTANFEEHFLHGLVGPLLERDDLQLVKGSFRRPFRAGGRELLDGGGRVTELVARPLLNLFVPELAGFNQPLAGEAAGRRALLESLRFPVGYGVEIAMMIDAARHAGVSAMAQVDLGTRHNRHQSLRELSVMATAVLATAAKRLPEADGLAPAPVDPATLALPSADGIELREVSLEERPPLRSVATEQRQAALAAVGPSPTVQSPPPAASR